MLWSKSEVSKSKGVKKVTVNGEDKDHKDHKDHKEDDYVDDYEENLKLKQQLEFKDQLLAALTKACNDKDEEISRLRAQMDNNTKFLQGTISDLIVKLATKEPPKGPSQLETYLANKNATAVTPVKKLP